MTEGVAELHSESKLGLIWYKSSWRGTCPSSSSAGFAGVVAADGAPAPGAPGAGAGAVAP